MCSIRSICTRLPIKMAEKSLENSRRMGGGGGGGPRKNMGKNAHNTNGHNKPNERRKNTSNRSQQGNLLPKTPFKIETTHFSSIFHSEVCRAAKYKVHAPNCNCSKVDRLRQRYHQEKDRNGNKSLAEQLTDLNISDPFDNLIVVPDTKTTPAIFVCNETTSNEFRNDATLCERKLANAIFDGNNDTTSLDALPFKVSCALCLLSHQKNGFVAIVATNSAQELQPVISKARKAASETANHKLHSDHAHFICAVQISSCRSLLQSAKTRSKHGKIVSEILTQLKHGGVDLPSSTDDASCTIQLGHHLTSLLWLQGKLKSSRRSQYIMVLGYVDGPTELVLDLPGGKRHLGESTLESLVREVKEECSLELDKEWLMERLSRRYGGVLDEKSEDIHVLESEKESGNVYFVLRPTMSNKSINA